MTPTFDLTFTNKNFNLWNKNKSSQCKKICYK